MAGADVRFIDEGRLEVRNSGFALSDGMGDFAAPLEVVGSASLASLRRALIRWTDEVGTREATLWLTRQGADGFDPDYAPREDVEISVRDGELRVMLTYVPDSAQPDLDAIEQITKPLLSRHRAELDTVIGDEQHGIHIVWIWLKPNVRSRTVNDVFEFGSDLLSLLAAADGGFLTRETTFDLIRGGRPDLLLGQRESEWLECKRAPYQLASDTAKFELAKDVAAFANCLGGGLLVIGARTARVGEHDTVRAITTFNASLFVPNSYRRIIDHRVFPAVDDLEVVRVEISPDNCVGVISIPPQPEHLRPFLVHGAAIDNRIHGSYMSLVTRRGDETIATSIPSIHALLHVGRVGLAQPARRAPD